MPLKKAGLDYLALGHIHKHYTEDGWIFNPGSIEANNIEEGQFERGAYLVEISKNEVRAELKKDYQQRPIVRLRLKLTSHDELESVEESAIALIRKSIKSQEIRPENQPIVELRIHGTIGFDRLDLDTKGLEQTLKALSGALIFLLRYDVDEAAFASPIAEDATRLEVEQEVFTDLLATNTRYKENAPKLAQGLIDLKERQMAGEGEESLYRLVENILQKD